MTPHDPETVPLAPVIDAPASIETEAERHALLRAFAAAHPAIEQELLDLRTAYGEDEPAGAFVRAMLVGARGLLGLLPPAPAATPEVTP